MKNSFKSKVIVLMLVSSIFSSFCMPVRAEYKDFGVEYVYDYIDNDDISTIRGIKVASMDNIYDSDISDLLTEAVKAKYKEEKDAQQDVASLLKYSISLYFSTSASDLRNKFSDADKVVSSIMDTLFEDVTFRTWSELFLLTKKDCQSAVDGRGRLSWANDPQEKGSDLYKTMDRLQIETMNKRLDKSEYSAIKSGFSKLGWTPEKVVAAVRNVAGKADPYAAAEFALMKAAARSSMSVTWGKDELKFDTAGKDIDNSYIIIKEKDDITQKDMDASYKVYEPGDYDLSSYVNLSDNKDLLKHNVTNITGFYISNSDIVEILDVDQTDGRLDPDKQNQKAIIKIKNVKGFSDVIIKRDPPQVLNVPGEESKTVRKYWPGSGFKDWNTEKDNDNWLYRFRIIVPNLIDVATDFVWDEKAPKVSWKGVENAKTYTVELYKKGEGKDDLIYTLNDVKVDPKTLDVRPSADFSSYATSEGDYYVKVKAYGTKYGTTEKAYVEEGDWSQSSPNFTVEETIPAVMNVKWENSASDDNYNVVWDSVDGADSYTVKVYKVVGENIYFVESKDTTECTCDVLDILKRAGGGEYIAKVIANKGEKRSVESNPTEKRKYYETVTIKGKVYLQTSRIPEYVLAKNLVTEDSQPYCDEAIITKEGVSATQYYTDKNGEYEITLRKGETFTLSFDRDCYLRSSLVIEATEDKVNQDVYLFYGDAIGAKLNELVCGDKTINSRDLSYFLLRMSAEKGVSLYDGRCHMDANTDNLISQVEYNMLLDNFGKNALKN